MNQIFISYVSEDYETADRLHEDLKALGDEPWMDKKDLRGGQDWEREIQRRIEKSSHVLILISSNSVAKRGYYQKEVRLAIDVLSEIPPGEIYAIPCRLDDSKPTHDKLNKLHWIDLFPSYDAGFRLLVQSLENSKPEAKKTIVSPRPIRDTSSVTQEVPKEVLALIQSNAERESPDDADTRSFIVENQKNAWRQLQLLAPTDVPAEVLTTIRAAAEADLPDDFSTRLYSIQNQIDAWRKLQKLEAPDVPADVLSVIVAAAEADLPDDFSTRLYSIQNHIEAWRKLQKLEAPDVPADVLSAIVAAAEADLPDDFATRLYSIQDQIDAWRKLQRLEAPDIPDELLRKIATSAERDFPRDFSTRLYVIESGLDSWREKHRKS